MSPVKEVNGVTGKDVAKRLLDYGYTCLPTLYFPQIVPECLMIEPTETLNPRKYWTICSGLPRRCCQKIPEILDHSAPHRPPSRGWTRFRPLGTSYTQAPEKWTRTSELHGISTTSASGGEP